MRPNMNNLTRMIGVLLVLYLDIATVQGVPNEGIPRVSYCDLLSASQTYDKKVVTTEALVGSSFHSVAIYDLGCMSTPTDNRSASLVLPSGWNSTKLGKKLSKVLRHGRTARVAFEGIFYGSGGPYDGDGTKFRFVMQRLISVEEDLKPEVKPSSSGEPRANKKHLRSGSMALNSVALSRSTSSQAYTTTTRSDTVTTR